MEPEKQTITTKNALNKNIQCGIHKDTKFRNKQKDIAEIVLKY